MHADGIAAEATVRLEAVGLSTSIAGLRSVDLGGVETVVVSIPLLAPSSTPRLVDGVLAGLAHECVLGDYPARGAARDQTVGKANRRWRTGNQSQVSWIQNSITRGHAITAAIPPVFDAYATVAIPDDKDARATGESALLQVLTSHTAAQSWWLGYLDTGAHDVVFDRVWKVMLYSGWS